MTDDIIWKRLIQSGDKEAFRLLYTKYFTPLCRFIYLYVRDEMEAEELATEVFLRVWEKREELDFSLSLKAYLFEAARNKAVNFIRDQKEKIPLDFLEETPDGGTSLEEELELKELRKLIEEAVCRLPERCQTIFRKSREESKSHREIAEELNISTKTIEAQITIALKHIRKFLGKQYYYLF